MSDKGKENENVTDLPIDDFNADGTEISAVGEDNIEESEKSEAKTVSSEELASLEKFKNDFLYLKAEFDNYKRRSIKERSDLIKYGSEPLVSEILNVLDVFDMALSQEVTPENIDGFKEGMDMTYKQFHQSLEKFNIVEIGKVGDEFDPNKHEALTQEPSADVGDGCVLRIFKKGYRFHDKIIRPAQVVVATKPAETSSDDNGGSDH